MLFPLPPMPELPAEQACTDEARLRYDDVAQDGRLIPLALPQNMDGAWSAMRAHPGHRACLAQGVIPILTRLTAVAIEEQIRVDQPVERRAGFQLAHDRDGSGQARIYMSIWTELRGAQGRLGPRPPGPRVRAGSVFAEHTFTRPFAPPEQRRVTSLPGQGGYPEVPEARYEARAPATAGEAPEGARWLDELAPDPAEVVFTLDQTDGNQHVNSLVYIRVFLAAVQRRLGAGGYPLGVLSRAVDIAYRKPCFAGDRVRAHVRLFEVDGGVGGAGFIAALGEDRPRCYARAIYAGGASGAR